MRFVPAFLILAIFVAACGGAEPESRLRIRVLALDGADLDIIRSLADKDVLPAFARVLKEGAHGKLHSEAPRHRDLVFTSLATGRPATEHGIRTFVFTDPDSDELLPIASFMRQTETIWEVLSENERRVAVIGWPGTWPPDPLIGHVVPDRFFRTDNAANDDVHPPEGSADLQLLRRRAEDISDIVLARFIRPPGPEDSAEGFRATLAAEESRRAIFRELSGNQDLAVMYSPLIAEASHRFMTCASPKLPRVSDEEFEACGQTVVEAYRYTDELLAKAISDLDDRTVLLVVSPYGFRHGIQRLRTDAPSESRSAADRHRPQGFVMAFGAGVRAGAVIKGARTRDIAPTILVLSGLAIASDLSGRFLSEAFTHTEPEGSVATYERGRRERLFREVHGDARDYAKRIEDHPPLMYLGNTIRLSEPMNLALIYALERNVKKTGRILRALLETEPENAVAHALLGDLNRMTAKWKEAEKEFREARRLAPQTLVYHARLSRVLRNNNRPEEALRTIQSALDLEPADPALHVLAAEILLDLERISDAEQHLKKAVELEPDAVEMRTALGLHHLSKSRFAAAAHQFRAAADLQPDLRVSWNNLAVALIRMFGKARDNPRNSREAFTRAESVLNETIERFPEYEKAWFNRAQLRQLAGDRIAALLDVEQALALDPEYEAAINLKKALEGD